MKKIFLLTVLVIGLLSIKITPVLALTIDPPTPTRIYSDCGTFVFHRNPRNEFDTPLTGLYYNNEYLEVVYLVDNLHELGDLFFTQDMRGFAILRVLFGHTFEFYYYGQLVKSYEIADLMNDLSMIDDSLAGISMWYDWRTRHHNIENETLTLTTLDNITYTFDLRTGEIITRSPRFMLNFNLLSWDEIPHYLFLIAGLVGATAITAIVLVVLLIKGSKRKLGF